MDEKILHNISKEAILEDNTLLDVYAKKIKGRCHDASLGAYWSWEFLE